MKPYAVRQIAVLAVLTVFATSSGLGVRRPSEMG